MEFFGFVLVHTVAKEDSEKCQSVEGLQEVELKNVANFVVEDPITIEHFIKKGSLDATVKDHCNSGVDFFVECLTLRCEEGSKVLLEGDHAGRPIGELIEEGIVHIADHTANVIVLP